MNGQDIIKETDAQQSAPVANFIVDCLTDDELFFIERNREDAFVESWLAGIHESARKLSFRWNERAHVLFGKLRVQFGF